MSKELEIMKYIESELIRHNDLLGEAHVKNDFGGFNDRQIEVDLLDKLYDELNKKFFDNKL
ncbi:MAG: hypothetical protein ACRC18_06640 [Cetobacterium sp.]